MGYNLETVPNTSLSQTISKKCNKFSGGINQVFNNALPKFATASSLNLLHPPCILTTYCF